MRVARRSTAGSAATPIAESAPSVGGQIILPDRYLASVYAIVRAAGLLLLVVFCVKAALLPLYFWLPETYGAATAPVAALFAIMTKVGVYAIARIYTLVFGDDGGVAANVAWPWLPPAGW